MIPKCYDCGVYLTYDEIESQPGESELFCLVCSNDRWNVHLAEQEQEQYDDTPDTY